jgi:hypothetical protein
MELLAKHKGISISYSYLYTISTKSGIKSPKKCTVYETISYVKPNRAQKTKAKPAKKRLTGHLTTITTSMGTPWSRGSLLKIAVEIS